MAQVQEKNNSVIQRFPKTLPGTFWGITTFYNPAHYKNKLENYKIFLDKIKNQGLNLITVELAFGSDNFELKNGDADILVQVRSDSIMWQKERLLNIGLKHLPADCDKVAWIDCDLIFENDNWIRSASDLLERYVAVQLYSFIIYMPKENVNTEPYYRFGASYAFNMMGDFLVGRGMAKGFPGMVGGAWACRRDALMNIGFFDKCILGSNDSVFWYAIMGKNKLADLNIFPESLEAQQTLWHKNANNIFCNSTFYVDGIIRHLWHGDLNQRNYLSREQITRNYNFDPVTDIAINKDGCFEWSSEKKEMHRLVKEYFFNRKEE